MVYDTNNPNNNDFDVNNMTSAERRAYFKGLKRGMTITYLTMTIRDATQQAFVRFPHLTFMKKNPDIIVNEFVNSTFTQMKQPIPTSQEISLNDLTIQETSLQILSLLSNMTLKLQEFKKAKEKAEQAQSNNNNKIQPYERQFPRRPPPQAPPVGTLKGQYDREKVRQSKAFELSREEREELR